jgi:GNAT superfamily N-acetyltransferase
MNSDLMTGAKCYGLYEGEEQIGFCAVRHMAHPKNKKIKMAHRLVILPDYQGIGLGGWFIDSIGKLYTADGYDFRIVTSARNMVHRLAKDPKWRTCRYNIDTGGTRKAKLAIVATHRKVKTASFLYKGE